VKGIVDSVLAVVVAVAVGDRLSIAVGLVIVLLVDAEVAELLAGDEQAPISATAPNAASAEARRRPVTEPLSRRVAHHALR
jgi:hypothetical protein